MIKITAESKGKQTELRINISGTGKDIVTEAVHIMQQLPKHIKKISQPLFLHFLAEIVETDVFGIDMGPKNRGEAEDDKDNEQEEE